MLIQNGGERLKCKVHFLKALKSHPIINLTANYASKVRNALNDAISIINSLDNDLEVTRKSGVVI